jgi:hypothetical protein
LLRDCHFSDIVHTIPLSVQTYSNVTSAKMFISAIVEVEFNRVKSVITEGQFMCLIGDGSTDVSYLNILADVTLL